MSETQAKVQISLRDGILELQGSEKFVSAQLAILQPLIDSAFKNPPAPQQFTVSSANQTTSQSSPTGDNASGLSAYENIFAEADGKIQILKTLPGGKKANKTVNGALLLAFANTLIGNSTTPYGDVRDLCSSHACLDSGNFSKTMKGQKELFIISGSGSSQTIKLTVPGKKRAEELAKQLN